MLQPEAANKHAVFFTHAREALTYQYERNPEDPRIGHTLTLEVDDFGNVLKSAAIGYGRRQPDAELSAEDQTSNLRYVITYSENAFTNSIDGDDVYRTPLPCEARTYELRTAFKPANKEHGLASRKCSQQLRLLASRRRSPMKETPDSVAKQKRLIEHVRTLYRPDDLGLSRNDPLASTAAGPARVAGARRGELQAGIDSRANHQNVWRQGHRPDARRGRAVCATREETRTGGFLQGAVSSRLALTTIRPRNLLTPEITFFCRGGFAIRFIARVSKPKAPLITMPTICSSSKPATRWTISSQLETTTACCSRAC